MSPDKHGVLRRILGGFQRKASAAGSAMVGFSIGKPKWMPREIKAYADEGYIQNWVVFTCVEKIAEAVASVEWQVHGAGGKIFETHPMLELIRAPNPLQGEAQFWR